MSNHRAKQNTHEYGKTPFSFGVCVVRFDIFVAMLIVAIACVFVFIVRHTEAAPNQQINYQGKLTNTSGVAVADGTYNMRFWLLTSPSVATTSALWTESLTGTNKVQVTNGLFSVMLGSTTPFTGVDFNQTLYLGVEIGGSTTPSWDGEMSPRKILGTVPAAFEADRLDGLTSTQFVRTDATSSIATSSVDTLLSITQNGTGDLLNLFDGSNEIFSVVDGGRIGIGTTSPSRLLTVQGGDFYLGGNLTATGTATFASLSVSGTTTLTYASTTAISGTNLNFTNGIFTNATSTFLAATTFGVGTDYITDLTGSGLSIVGGALTATGDGLSNWLFNGSRLTPSTTVGIGIFASSTIGNGTATGGLTISGNSTTTGNSYIASNLGVGTSSPYARLSIQATGGGVSPLFQVASSTNGAGTSTVFIVDAYGNVGAGTTSPTEEFDMRRDQDNQTTLRISNLTSGGSASAQFRADSNTSSGFFGAFDASHSITEWQDRVMFGSNSNASGVNITANAAGSDIRFYTNASLAERMRIASNGSIGIGTTSPSRLLTVQGGDFYLGGNLTATGTLSVSGLSTLTFASTTAISGTNLNFTNGIFTNATSTFLAATTFGVGTDYITDLTGSGLSIVGGALTATGDGLSNWLFNGSRLTPSTTVGIGIFASSTIGDGTATGGLTISGGATTTGNAYFAGNVGIGTTSSLARLNLQHSSDGVLLHFASSTRDIGIRTGDNLQIGHWDGSTYTQRMLVDISGRVGIGTLTDPYYNFAIGESPTAGVRATITNSPAVAYVGGSGGAQYIAEDTRASGPTNGAFVGLYSNDGAAMSSGDRLGGFFFGGYDGSVSNKHGAGVFAFADGTWSSASAPTYMTFETAASGSVTRTERLRVGSNGNIGIGTTSPSRLLTVQGGDFYLGGNLTATGTLTISGNTSLANATATSMQVTTLGVGSDYLTDITGSGLTLSSNALTCATGSASLFGCITTTDWSAFNAKVGSSSIDTSAELAALLTDETGTGNVVFSASPVFTGTSQFTGLSVSSSSTLGFASSTALTVSGNTFLANASTTAISGTNLNFTNGYFTLASTTYASTTALTLNGRLFDSTNSAGTNNQFLKSTASGVQWVSTSTLGFLASADIDTSGELATILTDETGTAGSVVFSGNPLLAGFRSNASSTIGDGTATGGLTISGGATTTGDAYFGGNLEVGSTTPSARLTVVGTGVQDLFRFSSTTGSGMLALDSRGVLQFGTSTLANVFINGGPTSTPVNVFLQNNIAIGNRAFSYASSTSNVGGNIAIGEQALYGSTSIPTTGDDNIAIGYQALMNNTNGQNNIALGYQALRANSSGGSNIAFGQESLLQNVSGTSNIGMGYGAIRSNTTGRDNIALGSDSLSTNVSGSYNTALSVGALNYSTGSGNVGVGYGAGDGLTSGNGNVFLGYNADATTNISTSTAIGGGATVGCSNCMVLGGLGANYQRVGIGTTSPSRLLTVQGGDFYLGGNLTATGTLSVSGLSTLTFASSTAISGTNLNFTNGYFTLASTTYASTTAFTLNGRLFDASNSAGTSGQILRSTAAGVQWVSTSTLGLLALGDIDTSGELATLLTDETGTAGSLVFSGNPLLAGFRSNASSTIGDGSATGGLTVSGNSTTTGNAYFGGNLSIGTTTSNYSVLNTVGIGALSLSTKGATNFMFGTDPSNSAFSNIWPGGVTPSATNYAWQTKNDGTEVWFNAPTPGKIFFTIGNNAIAPMQVQGTSVGIGYHVNGTSLSQLFSVNGNAGIVGSLGVGTTTPYGELVVFSSGGTTSPLFTVASSTNGAGTTTAFMVDAYGRVGIGTSTPAYGFDIYANNDTSSVISTTYAGSSARPVSYGRRARGNLTSPTGLLSGDSVYRLIGQGYTGTTYNDVAEIRLQADGTLADGNTPGAITFHTVPTAGSAVVERMKIDRQGYVGIGTTSPSRLLTVQGGDFYLGGNLTATGTLSVSGLSTLTFASTTGISGTNLNFTNGIFTNATSTTFQATTLGVGSDYITDLTGSGLSIVNGALTASGGSSNWLFNGSRLTPSTTVGIGIFASSTIGGGTGATGLTISGGATTTGNAYFGGNIGVGTTTPQSLLSLHKTGINGTSVGGMQSYLQFTNSTENAVSYGHNTYIVQAPTATGTLVGSILRIEDNSIIGSVVRGLEVQAHRGTNTKGENTGINAFGRTFGIKGTTEGDAGEVARPAGVFAETRGTTQGNALRAYSSSITTETLVSLEQAASTYEGTALGINMGTNGGSFSSSTSRFINLMKNGVSQFTVLHNGATGIGSSSPSRLLTVQGGDFYLGGNLTATGTLTISGNTSLANATATSMQVTTLGVGTDYITDLTGSGLSIVNGALTATGDGLSNWLFNGSRLTPSTTVGIGIFASSTIGDGTATGGLTISGNSTTTGNSYIASNLGVGTSSPYARLTITGTAGSQIPLLQIASSTGTTTFAVLASGDVEVANTFINSGITWTSRTSPALNSFYVVGYGGGRFVGLADSGTFRLVHSVDGVRWATGTIPSTVGTFAPNSVVYANGLFVAVSQSSTNRVITSPDGIVWTARNATEQNTWWGVTYGNETFVAVSVDGTNRVMTSSDGITWTARSAAQANQWTSVTFGNGLFVAVANSGTNRVMTSPDGITWTVRSAASADNWYDVSYGNGLFVAVASQGSIMTSSDGITWTSRTSPVTSGLTNVAYGDGVFVAVSTSTATSTGVLTSPDGINWTTRSAAGGNQWYSVVFGNGTFVSIGDTGSNRIMTSGKQVDTRLAHDNVYQGGMSILGGAFNIGTTTLATTSPFAANILNIASTTGSSLLTMLQSGYLGLGTSSPSRLLTVQGGDFWLGGNLTATGTGSFANLLVSGSSTIGGGTATSGLTIVGTATSTDMIITSLTADRMLFAGNDKNLRTSGASAAMRNSLSDETGLGFAVFSVNPSLSGFTSSASSTIGDGTATGGLTIYGGATTTGNAYFGGNISLGSTTASALLTMDESGITGSTVAGIKQYLGFANATLSATLFGDQSTFVNTPTATSTLIGKEIRIQDTSALGNTVRGLQVLADRGTNTKGENSGIFGFGRTFGIQGTTQGDAGESFLPAGVLAESKGTTQGNALRAVSDTLTTEDLVSFFHQTSNYTGTALKINLGNSGGTFLATSTGKFLDLQAAGTSRFMIAANGSTTIGDGVATASLRIPFGGICVDNDGSCVSTTTGQIRSVTSVVGNSDLAEMYFSSEYLESGEIIALRGGLSVERATEETAGDIIGVVSTKPGQTLGFDDTSLEEGERGYPIGLKGRVPIKLSTINGPIKKGDRITLSPISGVGMKATETSRVVGIALEDFDGTHAYSAGYLNQFGDDMVRERITRRTTIDPRTQNGCYYGAGRAPGEEPCLPDHVTTTVIRTTTDNSEYLAMRAALTNQPAQQIMVEGGDMTHVGQVIMFIELGWHQNEKEMQSLAELVASTTLPDGSVADESLFDRIKTLAQGFVDGVLTLTGIKADRVEVKNELCVDGVCLNADDLRALLESAHRTPGGAGGGSGESTTPPQDGGGGSTGGETGGGGSESDTGDVGGDAGAGGSGGSEGIGDGGGTSGGGEVTTGGEPAPEPPAEEAPEPEPEPEPAPEPPPAPEPAPSGEGG